MTALVTIYRDPHLVPSTRLIAGQDSKFRAKPKNTFLRFLPASFGGKPGENLPRGVKSHSEQTGHVSSLPSPRSIRSHVTILIIYRE